MNGRIDLVGYGMTLRNYDFINAYLFRIFEEKIILRFLTREGDFKRGFPIEKKKRADFLLTRLQCRIRQRVSDDTD